MKSLKYVATASLLAFAAPSFAATTFDMEGVALGAYGGSLVINDGPTILTVSVEGNPNGFVVARNPSVALLGNVGLIGSNVNPIATNQFAPLRFSFNQLIDSITFNFGDGGGDNDSPVTISAYDTGDNLLGSVVETYPANFSAGKSATLNFAGASYFIAMSTPGSNDHSLHWDISNFRIGGAIPEPATWAMLIFGFGLIGGAMRRSRRTVSVQYS